MAGAGFTFVCEGTPRQGQVVGAVGTNVVIAGMAMDSGTYYLRLPNEVRQFPSFGEAMAYAAELAEDAAPADKPWPEPIPKAGPALKSQRGKEAGSGWSKQELQDFGADAEGYAPNDRVRHKVHGQGTVSETYPRDPLDDREDAPHTMASVRFGKKYQTFVPFGELSRDAELDEPVQQIARKGRQNPKAQDAEGYAPNDRVRHKVHGQGTVSETYPRDPLDDREDAPHTMASVRFGKNYKTFVPFGELSRDAKLGMDPLTNKGGKILKNMEGKYGEKKGKSVFYASKNKGTISGVDAEPFPWKHLSAQEIAEMARAGVISQRQRDELIQKYHTQQPNQLADA